MEKYTITASFVLLLATNWFSTTASASGLGLTLPWSELKPAAPSKKPPRTVRCRHTNFPRCFMVPHTCPPQCPHSCRVDCTVCKAVCNCYLPGAVCDDPRFVGGDGITFYFHGRRDRDFCLVTDPSLHINARFIGKPHPEKKRDFTWIQSISVLVPSGDPGPHTFHLAAEKTAKWDDSVDRLTLRYDSGLITMPGNEGAVWRSPDGLISIKRTSPFNSVIIESKNKFEITAIAKPITKEESDIHRYNVTDDDCFAHLDVSFKFYDLRENVDGVLGRTYRKDYVSKVNVTNPMPVVGGEREFVTSGLFATDCAVSKFDNIGVKIGTAGGKKMSTGDSKMVCRSNPTGSGVLCSR